MLFKLKNGHSELRLRYTNATINGRNGYLQGFRGEKDENRADLCLRSIVFYFERGRL